MKILRLISSLLFLIILSGCISSNQSKAKEIQITSVDGEVEPLLSSKQWGELLIFTAKSNGCTKHDSFTLQTDGIKGSTVVVSIVRTQPDHCRRRPEYKEFQLRLPEYFKDYSLEVSNPSAENLPERK